MDGFAIAFSATPWVIAFSATPWVIAFSAAPTALRASSKQGNRDVGIFAKKAKCREVLKM